MAHVIITGAADGIGRALALHYGAGRHAITIVDVDRELAARTHAELAAQGVSARVVHADLATPLGQDQALAELSAGPPADILIHSAGISAVGRFGEVAPERQQTVIRVNFEAPLVLTAGMLAKRRISRGGTLVFIASLSVFTGYPGALGYAASKDGLAAYARSLRSALGREQINVLSVYPGPTRTAHARRYSPDNRREQRRMPPERLAELIAAAVARRDQHLLPGPGARFFALLGNYFPGLTEYAMRRTIYDRLP
ncbi:MAG: SDR family NAD(P)-dependent oxidoreductase [Oscillochloris sp.]|nr:SDR family NAD(P)-dependent oxidoreductase [Oscillochloris sp.]